MDITFITAMTLANGTVYPWKMIQKESLKCCSASWLNETFGSLVSYGNKTWLQTYSPHCKMEMKENKEIYTFPEREGGREKVSRDG